MPPKRRSIRDRDTEPTHAEATGAQAEAAIAPSAPEPRPTTKDTAPGEDRADSARQRRHERSALDERMNLGVYLTAETYEEMKAAYLADWSNHRGDADTLYRWVTNALSTHAALSSTSRVKKSMAGAKRATTRTGNTKAFKVATDVYQRMQDAIAADESAGHWSSESAWSVDAITHAISAARAANGGTLPTPPARLPNRLKRR